MKKLLIALLLALIVPASLMAAPLLQIGATGFYDKAVADEDFVDGITDFDLNSFHFGAEVRVNPFFLSLAVPATIGFGGDSDVSFGTQPSANINISITDFFDLAVGLGMKMNFSLADGKWLVNGASIDTIGDAFMNSQLFYRAAATFNILFLGVGVSANVPTADSFSNFTFSPDWEATTVSVSLLFNLF